MTSRSVYCSIVDWRYARATAAQWPEASVIWAREFVRLAVDDPTLCPADEACLADRVADAIDRSARMHEVVGRTQ